MLKPWTHRDFVRGNISLIADRSAVLVNGTRRHDVVGSTRYTRYTIVIYRFLCSMSGQQISRKLKPPLSFLIDGSDWVLANHSIELARADGCAITFVLLDRQD
jgi:hypothetical protein